MAYVDQLHGGELASKWSETLLVNEEYPRYETRRRLFLHRFLPPHLAAVHARAWEGLQQGLQQGQLQINAFAERSHLSETSWPRQKPTP